MLRKWLMFAVILFWLSSSFINFTQGENVLFLNLFKDEESSENIDSNLERDLISTYNFDEDDDNIVFKKDTLNNTDLELTGHKSQSNDLEDGLVTLRLVTNPGFNILEVTEEDIYEEKAASHSKYTTRGNENSHFNIASKATVEDGTSVSKESAPLCDTHVEGGLYSFVRLCFDIIASFIQGVMRGIMSVGDTVTNSKPTDMSTDYSQSSTSRIWKRDIPSIHITESSAVKSTETTTSPPDLKINLQTTRQSKDDANTNNDNKAINSNLSVHSMKSSAKMENNKTIKNESSSIQIVKDRLVSASPSALNDKTELNKNDIDIGDKANGDFSTTTTSIPNSHVQEENIRINTKKDGHDMDSHLADSTSDENSSSFLLNDFINKQNDPKLREIIQKEFATAKLYPQPQEGEYNSDEETSTATIILATGGVLVVLVLVAVVGLVAAYKYGLIKSDFGIGRTRLGNRNPPCQRTTMA